jgi:hypothetical protein
MMAHKDARVAAVRELLAHMRLVKMLAWEGLFVRKVRRPPPMCPHMRSWARCAVQGALLPHSGIPGGEGGGAAGAGVGGGCLW